MSFWLFYLKGISMKLCVGHDIQPYLDFFFKYFEIGDKSGTNNSKIE